MKVKVNNKTYINFSEITVTKDIDSVASTFDLSAYFDPENKDHLEAIRPLSYQDVVIYDNDDNVMLTGMMLNTAKEDESTLSLVRITGYSNSGILADITVPINVNSVQNNGLTLKQIVEKLIQPYDIKLIVDENSSKRANEKIKRTYTYMNEELDKYITNLALRKNIVTSHNEFGDLLFISIDDTIKPKRLITKENSNSMAVNVNGQNMHSEISATRQTSRRNRKNPNPDVKFSVIKNPLVKKNRPKNNRTNMNQSTDLDFMAKSFYMEELENISVSIGLNWFEKELKVGDFIQVLNPDIFLFKPARLLIKSAQYTVSETEASTSFVCVIPEAYTGDEPKDIFEL